jgi:hypothetical protein
MALELLPTVAERNALVADTATLIQRAGLEPYVAAVLVEPTDRFFPDPWQADVESLSRLARRVFDYVGLVKVAIEVEAATSERAIAGGIWAIELGANTVRLGADRERLDDPLATIATLARFAAIVFRADHEVVGETDEVEGRAIDATTVYLGLGLITTNAAYRYRASGELRGSSAITRWSHSELGALSPQAMSYLLAAQLVARAATSSEVRAVAKILETNQATYLAAAIRELDGDELRTQLGLPDRGGWPPRRQPPPDTGGAAMKLVTALRADGAPAIPMAIAKVAPTGGRNVGQPVFRMKRTRAGVAGFVGLFAAMVPMIALSVKGYAGLAVGVLVGTSLACAVVGSRMRRDECADSRCSRILPPGIERCPGCGGTIAGTLLRGENRLEAEERLGLVPDELAEAE